VTACAGTPTPSVAPTETPLPTAAVIASGTAAAQPLTPASTPTSAAPRTVVYFTEAADNVGAARLGAFTQQQSWQFDLASAREAEARLAEEPWAVVSVSAELTPAQWLSLAQQHSATHFILAGMPEAGAEIPTNLLFLGGPASREDQAGFIAGVVAGHATETERVAVFGDSTTPFGLKYRNGFLAGVRYTCPRCRLDTMDLQGTEATEFARAEAVKYAALGADVVYAGAGPAGEAALVAAAQSGAWVIAAQPNSTALPDKLLTSVYLDVEQAFIAALTAHRDGQPRSGVEPLSLANGGIVLIPFGPNSENVLSPLDRQEIEATLQKLADGSLETGVDPVTGEEK
jgi:basic membrane protein A